MLGEWREHGSRQGSAGLAAGIRLLVLDGQLPPGTTLPAERELAAALGVSRTLVATAWDLLRADGMVVSRRGSGSRTALPTAVARPAAPIGDQPLDLARAAPAAPAGFAAAIDAVRGSFAAELSGHGYHELGIDPLRERLAERFAARGLPTTPEQILVTNGAHHGLALVLRAMAGPGDRVLVEQPTYPNALEALRAAHVVPVPVPMPEADWDLDGIEAALRQAAPRLAYLIVDFHNPTGRRLDAPGRERLAAILRRARTPVVVDETLVELDLDGDPLDGPPPMATFAPNLVITVGSASKSHWGGLRLGWVRAPEEVIGRLAAARHAFDLGSPVFEQLLLAQLYTDPEPMLRARRAEVAVLRGVLADAVRAHCPQWRFELPAGGLSLWCELPGPVGTRIAVAAQNVGVRVAPGARFGVHGGLERWLRLPYTLPAPQLVDAVRRLARVGSLVTGSPGTIGSDGLIPVA
ncbi:PLP-dependent aminotransferase family protein [Actinokineospora sp. NBRC 105648]|uniref:MocR-like transcription factor YczR n=1 Tax=Actinokineospora sp. NBRC 105648 TaxID=3032206 RepID=UPI0024A1E1D3|nr:PLP-dependent aminotransferase family protein [Actinokineospora sp. NBRC 105648]GLZ38282.1 GntR family transcriptional regulator [Actinokineospora sp. NBRC 105648]